MSDYVPIPVAMLELGRPLPVDVWAPDGRLLLRRGQPIATEQDRALLQAHRAGMTPLDAHAWQRSYERMVRRMLAQGAALDAVAHLPLPAMIEDTDYVQGQEVLGGWLDLHESLRGLHYQGKAAINPLSRLEGFLTRGRSLLAQDPDEALFTLFQCLADPSLGYCTTHALLCAVVCDLTAQKLDLDDNARSALFMAALGMNIAMARLQDALTLQKSGPDPLQRDLIRLHAQHSSEVLAGFGLQDVPVLDLVRWHHEPDDQAGLPAGLLQRRILRVADGFVAKMAARKSRAALSSLGAVKSIFLGSVETAAAPGAAMATVLGFYPPGTYVKLLNGETAVVVARGARAHTPHVASIIDAHGMPLSKYLYRDTAQPALAIDTPQSAQKIRVKVIADKVAKVRVQRASAAST